jgi:hypothetical protein
MMKTEGITLRLEKGTADRIRKVLRGGEVQSAFIRHAVMKELERREGKKQLKGETP